MGHSDPQLEVQARQQYWMPFSPNREFKQEPRMFVRAAWDPKANFGPDDMLRLSIGGRF